MKRLFRFLLSVAASCGLAIAATPNEDLSGYDKLGPLEQKAWESPAAIQKQVRKFLRDHWSAKQRAFVTVTFHTKEGEPTTDSFLIESTSGGSWHIRGRRESTYSDRRMVTDPNKQPDRHEASSFEAIRIVRVETRSERLSCVQGRIRQDRRVILKE